MANPENILGQGFHTNPERINRNGRPPKLVTHIIKELKAKGYKPLTASQIKDTYLLLQVLNKEDLTAIKDDEEAPMVQRIIAKRLLNTREDDFETVEKLIDRVMGKPKQSYDHTTKGEKIQTGGIDLTKMTPEILEALQKQLENGSEDTKTD